MSISFSRRVAPSLIALMLGCTALAAPAHAGWLFGGDDDDAKKPAPAAQQAPADKPVPAADIEGNVRQARMLRLAGNYDEAIHHLSQLMLVASDDPRVVGEYGKTLAQMGRAQDAMQFLTRAQQLNGADWSIYSALGVAYDQLGDQAQAQTAYQHALVLKPNEPSVLNNYALSRMLAKDPDGARKLAAQVRAAGGDADPMIRRNLAMIDEMAPAPAGEKAESTKTAEPAAAPAPKVATAALPAPAAKAQEPPAHKAATEPAPQRAVVASNTTAFTVAGNTARPFVTLPATPPASAQPSAARSGTIDVSSAPKPVQPAGVVMQQVPVDPLAGPVARKATHEPRALATHEQAPKAVAANEPKASPKPAAKADVAAAKAEPAKAQPQLARAEPKKADAKPEPKSDARPVKAAAKDAVPALRLSANAY